MTIVSEADRAASTAAIVMARTRRLGVLHASSSLPAVASSHLPLHLATRYDQRWPVRGGSRPAGARETSSFRFARLACTPHLDAVVISRLAGMRRCRYPWL